MGGAKQSLACEFAPAAICSESKMNAMTTRITLEDGRILGTSNWAFDAILECAAKELTN
jgi:hypothetical protein